MASITDLRQKRAALWEKTKKFLDNAKRENDMLSAEDVETYEKMESEIVALGKEIDILERQAEMEKRLNSPVNTPVLETPKTNGNTKTGRASDEYKQAFWKLMKNNQLSYSVHDTLQIGTDSDGGYLVPDEYETVLIDKLADENIMRGLTTIITSANGDKKIPVVASHGEAVWTDEGSEYTESDDEFGTVSLGAHKLSTIIKVSEELLNDSAFNLETYISSEFARRMGAAEELAFINGNGTGKPTGVLNTAEVGVTSAVSNAITTDEIIDLYHSLRTPYRKNAVFMSSDSTIKAIRKLKDSNGQYLWQPSIKDGETDTLLGKPVYTSSSIANAASGTKPIAFGDLSYYWIGDRQGVTFRRLNELYAANGQVGFLTTKRVDARLIVPEAVKILKMKGTVSTGG